MKRKFFWLLALMTVFLASCADKQLDSGISKDGMVDFTIKASIPQGIKTYASDNGGATNVDPTNYDLRYIMEVWTKDNKLAYRGYKIVSSDFTSKDVTFDVRLLAKVYDFVFWADFVTKGTTKDLYYATSDHSGESQDFFATDASLVGEGLQNITIKQPTPAYGISDDARDAFFHIEPDVDLATSDQLGHDIQLKRPFGKYRLVATDVPDGYLSTDEATSVNIKYVGSPVLTVPAGFNALTGNLTSDVMTLDNYDAPIVSRETDFAVGNTTYPKAIVLAFDYIFAPSLDTDPNALTPVSFEATVKDTNDKDMGTRSISTIPIQRNKLTTVIGNFFTNTAVMNIIVEDMFDGEAGPVNADEINGDINDDYTIIIPPNSSPTLTYIFTGTIANGVKITVRDSTCTPPSIYDGTVNLAILKPTGAAVDINLPGATVNFLGTVGSLTSITADNTLNVLRGSNISSVDVIKGNVKIYGTVTNVTKESGAGDVLLAIGPGSNRPISNTVIKDALAVDYADGLLLTEGNYPVIRNVPVPGDYDYYLPILKDGYKIIGEGNVVIYGNDVVAADIGGVGAAQQILAVMAANVKISGITLMPANNLAYDPIDANIFGVNNIVRVDKEGFEMTDCTIMPNTIKSYPNNAGSIYINDNSGTSTFKNNKIWYSGMSVRPGANAIIEDNDFYYGSAHGSWAHACVSVRGEATVQDNRFHNINPVTFDNTPLVAKGDGIMNLWTNSSAFPTNDIYWTTMDNGQLYLNGSIVNYVTPANLTSALAAGGTVQLQAMEYPITDLTIGNDIIINGNGAKITAESPSNQTTPVSNRGNNPAIFITGDANVKLSNLSLSSTAPGNTPVDGITIIGGELTLDHVTIDGVGNPTITGAQHGRGVTAYSSNLIITNSVFSNINKNAIHLYGSSDAQISNCTFNGSGSVLTAQNGVVFMIDGSNATTGKVTSCSFKNYVCSTPHTPGDGGDGCGVLIYSDSSTPVTTGIVDGGGNSYSNNDQNWFVEHP